MMKRTPLSDAQLTEVRQRMAAGQNLVEIAHGMAIDYQALYYDLRGRRGYRIRRRSTLTKRGGPR